MPPEAPITWNLVLAALSGGTGLLVSLLLKKLGDMAKDVKEIAQKVGTHAEKLAAGDQRMTDLERRVGNLEARRLRAVDE